MNGFVILMTALTVAATAAYILRRVRINDIPGTLIKSAASLCFVALGLVAAAGSGHAAMALPAVMALVAGLTGDIFLNINVEDGQEAKTAGAPGNLHSDAGPDEAKEGGSPGEDLWTLAGFGAFILAHFCNIGFMIANGAASLLPAAILIGVLGGIFIYAAPKLLGLHFAGLRLVASIYAAVIITGTAQAVLRAVFFGGTGPVLYAAGYVLFLLSDIVLAYIMFTEDGETRAKVAGNLALYYGAQILIALSLLWL